MYAMSAPHAKLAYACREALNPRIRFYRTQRERTSGPCAAAETRTAGPESTRLIQLKNGLRVNSNATC